MNLDEMAKEVGETRESKGFYTPSTIAPVPCPVPQTEADAMLGKLMLVVTEVAEVAEAVRHGDVANFEEELADAVIRILDICGTMGIDLEQAILSKMAKNRERPAKHGKVTNL